MVSRPQATRARLVALPSPTLAQADDATLARAAATGDPRASGVLWDRFSPAVRRMLRRTLGPGAQVEGLVEQVFLRALPRLGSLPDSAQLKPFFVAVTVRSLARELRRRRIRRALRLESPYSSDFFSGADAKTRAALAALYRILDELDTADRLVFALRHFEGMQIAELAAATESSVARVKRRLTRANQAVEDAVRQSSAFRSYTCSASFGDGS
jgi:RNA polymerase sigma-70 factor (ECF subfamily)